ncbi:hypothetical protein ACOSQ2_022222 [Xanthoceras sorbifolium]
MPDVPVADVLGGMLPVAYDMVECHFGMLHSHGLCRLYTLLIHSDFLEAILNRSDSIPTVLSILMGLTKRMKAVAKVLDEFMEKIIDEHVQSKDSRSKDFVDLMLSFLGSEETGYRTDRGHIKAVFLDMLGAAVDTSTSSIEWVQSELMKDPRTMKKLQNELDNVVGKDRKVKESDLDNLGILGHGCRGNLQASSSGSTHIP